MIKNSPDKSGIFSICTDTGGTFTDCIATTPPGKTVRCKVLSSSAIRGTVSVQDRSDQLIFKSEFRVPDHLYKGCSLIFLDEPDHEYLITGSYGKQGIIKTEPPLQMRGMDERLAEIRSPEEAPILATRLITGTPPGTPFPPVQMRLATTKGTNALLERRGGKTLFLITEGFKDLLEIRNQQRPDLFSLDIQKPDPFYHRVAEVPERIDADGNVLKKPDLDKLKREIEPHLPEFDAAAICLMHSYRNPDHELQVEQLLHELGVERVSVSSRLSPTIKIVPRAITADLNACLSPVMESYLERIATMLQNGSLKVMTSAGYLAEAEHYTPKDGLLSGPAGGVAGAAAVGERVSQNLQGFQNLGGFSAESDLTGFENLSGLGQSTKIISFDMGGTSTDVARYDGSIETIYEHTVGDATLSSPAVDIETVAAGGGSVCGFDGKSLTVGPESAGADPGPACYGRGGPLTITDVNLLCGRLHPSNFHISIDPAAAEAAFNQIEKQINQNRKTALERSDILHGFLDIANERMAQAIRKISIQKGFNPADYAMVAFGGAGAQHALAVAEKLKITTILVPEDAGLLSAYGLQQSQLSEIATRQVLKPLKEQDDSLQSQFRDLEQQSRYGLEKQGVREEDAEISRRILFMRLEGQDSSLEIEWSPGINPEQEFRDNYENRYGHWVDGRDIEIEAIRVIAEERKPQEDAAGNRESFSLKEIRAEQPAADKSGRHSFKLIGRSELQPGNLLRGPALITDPFSTTVIDEGWQAVMLDDGTLLVTRLEDQSPGETGHKQAGRDEMVNLQLYTNRFRSVADQMGEMLRRTSLSVNVKERLDYSCALLDADGYLVVNAPHIPVHLGAMGTCVRAIINLQGFPVLRSFSAGGETLGEFAEGDILITNHPAFGGSHLPDITVITPVFVDGKRIGFVASRAHHAEIGGKRPGSMPPDATNLAEEGVVIPPMFLAKEGKYHWEKIEKLLREDRWPSRSPGENLADIRAAAAANHRGVQELKKLAATFGTNEVTTYMQKLKEYASERMRLTLEKIADGTYRAEEKLDDGSLLKVCCTVSGSGITVDFTGTSGVHPGNLNANPSIVNSVLIYVMRLLVDELLPLNDGLLDPVEVILPEGMLNPVFPDDPAECPAVVGGNIETSQRLTDTLLKAFGLAACSYGTMNNVLFGNDRFGYYETVAGGTGAGDGFHGASAVHQHMTNTRAADPEILEHRYPVRLQYYAIRKNSGGRGKWNGGEGIIRELTFLEPVSLSVLAQHRVVPPYGLKGGEPGKTGRHWVERKNGEILELDWRDGADLEAGDRFILHTPGGGGFDWRVESGD